MAEKNNLMCKNCGNDFQSAAKVENRSCPACGAKTEDITEVKPVAEPDRNAQAADKIARLKDALAAFADMPFEPTKEDDFELFKLSRAMGSVTILNGDVKKAKKAMEL